MFQALGDTTYRTRKATVPIRKGSVRHWRGHCRASATSATRVPRQHDQEFGQAEGVVRAGQIQELAQQRPRRERQRRLGLARDGGPHPEIHGGAARTQQHREHHPGRHLAQRLAPEAATSHQLERRVEPDNAQQAQRRKQMNAQQDRGDGGEQQPVQPAPRPPPRPPERHREPEQAESDPEAGAAREVPPGKAAEHADEAQAALLPARWPEAAHTCRREAAARGISGQDALRGGRAEGVNQADPEQVDADVRRRHQTDDSPWHRMTGPCAIEQHVPGEVIGRVVVREGPCRERDERRWRGPRPRSASRAKRERSLGADIAPLSGP